MGFSPIISDLLRIWINAVVQLEFILLIILALLFDVYSTTQYYRLFSHFTVRQPDTRWCLVSHWLWLRSLTKVGLSHELLSRSRFSYVRRK